MQRRGDVIIFVGIMRLHLPDGSWLHNGELWVLNSGTGELGVVEGAAKGEGTFVPRVFCPGFARGLTIRNGFAYIGLSKSRYLYLE